jgi:hypothetical protein
MCGGSAQAQAARRFVPVFTWNYGTTLPAAQESTLARYSFSDLSRDYYKDSLGQNTWSVLTSLNPAHEVYTYEFSVGTWSNMDTYPAVDLNNISRWNNARGHSMGNLNTHNPDLFLLDGTGSRIQNTGYSWWLLDVGNPKFWRYWEEAVTADIIRQPWKGTGIYIDGPGLEIPSDLSASPAKYPTGAAWIPGAINYVLALTSALHAQGQKAWFNLAPTYIPTGQAAWITLDSSPNHPDVMMDEGAFVTPWGSHLANFCNEAGLKSSIDTMQSVRNTRVAMSSSLYGLPGAAGTDNYGNPVTYWDAFYFALACFLLGKNTAANNSYFSWHDGNQDVQWFSEYDINLGAAVGPYQVTPYGTSNIYWREYQKGYVYANLSKNNADRIVLPTHCREVTHQNVTNPFSGPIITTLSLTAKRAAILVKSSVTAWE